MNQIKATIVADSRSIVNGKRITTFELEYPRWIHGEILTHRMFSRNAMSSRAVPIEKMIEQVTKDPAVPVHWGLNQPGMQAKEQLSGDALDIVKHYWKCSAEEAADSADLMSSEGAHKQIVNRILEPFQLMKTVVTATEFGNWFWLRNHGDAQPEIKNLAECMLEALGVSEPIELEPADWHVPYFDNGAWFKCDTNGVSLEDALAISASCCAQVSYRLLDDSIEKARMIYNRLVESKPVHASPFEHQATPMQDCGYDMQYDPKPTYIWEGGVTHMDKEGKFWSGNFQSWVQHRQLIPDNVYKEK